MPIFKCEQCGCVENTALCLYWKNKRTEEKLLCSACDPLINRWHGVFAKKKATDFNYYIGEDGFLYNPDHPPSHTELVGPIE